VSHFFAGLGLIAVACAWLLLPLLPTLKELRHGTDNQPFQIIQENPFNPFHFADSLAKRLEGIRDEINQCRTHGKFGTGYLEKDQAYRVIARADEISETPVAPEDSVLVICSPASLGDDHRFTNELYVTDDLTSGAGTIFSAVLCDAAVDLGPRTTILRWAHARSRLRVGESSVLCGRLTSEKRLHLGSDTTFERLHAPRIDFGGVPPMRTSGPHLVRRRKAKTNSKPLQQRMVVPGDLLITADRVWTGDFIIKGSLTVAAGSLIEGSLKSYGDMQIGAGAVIVGSVVSARNVELGQECAVLGPVISEKNALLGSGCCVGTEQRPTTVIAMTVKAAAGAVVFGTVWARDGGHVEN
jgi:hypothetical protein